jgi:two-component system, NarL family, invasion response regulator UvrY
MIEVLIADDNPLQRKLLTMALSEDENIVVTAEAENGEEVLRLVNEKSFDVIILDIELSKKSGIEVFKELKMQGKNIPVIIVSNYPKEEFENAVLAIGVSCYIEKSDVPDKIIEAVRTSTHAV